MEKDTTILPLEDLAQRITEHSESSDRSKLEAARLLADARRRVDDGEIPGVTWKDWTEENLSLSSSRIKELLGIGQADDPAAALARQRAKTRTRVKSHRKQKAARDSEREQGAVDSDTQEPGVTKTGGLGSGVSNGDGLPANTEKTHAVDKDRAVLLTWAETAPIEFVSLGLTLIELEFGPLRGAIAERKAA